MPSHAVYRPYCTFRGYITEVATLCTSFLLHLPREFPCNVCYRLHTCLLSVCYVSHYRAPVHADLLHTLTLAIYRILMLSVTIIYVCFITKTCRRRIALCYLCFDSCFEQIFIYIMRLLKLVFKYCFVFEIVGEFVDFLIIWDI